MPDAAKPGVLAGTGVRVERVHLDDPAVVLGGLGAARIVEPAVGLGELELLGLVVLALPGLFLGAPGTLAVVVLEVLLAGQNRVPRRHPAAAVGERADELPGPADLLGARGGSGYVHGGRGVHAAVVPVVLGEGPPVALLAHPEDGAADGGLLQGYLLGGLFGLAVGVPVVGDPLGVGVLMVDP